MIDPWVPYGFFCHRDVGLPLHWGGFGSSWAPRVQYLGRFLVLTLPGHCSIGRLLVLVNGFVHSLALPVIRASSNGGVTMLREGNCKSGAACSPTTAKNKGRPRCSQNNNEVLGSNSTLLCQWEFRHRTTSNTRNILSECTTFPITTYQCQLRVPQSM